MIILKSMVPVFTVQDSTVSFYNPVCINNQMNPWKRITNK